MAESMYEEIWPKTSAKPLDLLKTTPRNVRGSVKVGSHTGHTGGLWNGPISNIDPYLLVPICRQPRFLQTRLILLHAGYPWIQHAGAMAHSFPHLWVDIGWTTPWISQRIADCYRELTGLSLLDLRIGYFHGLQRHK